MKKYGHVRPATMFSIHDRDVRPSNQSDAVVEALPRDPELVVVAQSLGAFAGPLVATRVPVAQLVLLAPMIPKPGETAGEWWSNTRHDEAIADLLARYGPMSSWGPDALAEVFLHDVDPLVAAENESFQGAPGRGMFTEPWPLERWPDVPTAVLAPRGDRLFPREFQ